MNCYKCGKDKPLHNGICNDCYKEISKNKREKKKNPNFFKTSYILNHLEQDEKILIKLQNSNIIYFYILSLLGISTFLFPKTIIEFFINNQKIYFLLFIFNILFFFFAIHLSFYFSSREIYLTNKKIIGKWGLFKIKKINIPLNQIRYIDITSYCDLEIETNKKNYFFDFVGNSEKFKLSTINQIKNLIDSTNDEKILTTFSHSLQEIIDGRKLKNSHTNMIPCKCCNKLISKDSITCVHCGEPILENERSADLFLETLCFAIPPIGIILFLLNIGPFPKLAKQCLLSSMISLLIIIIIYLSYLSMI